MPVQYATHYYIDRTPFAERETRTNPPLNLAEQGNWAFIKNNVRYVGRCITTNESVRGIALVLQFADNTTYSVLKQVCARVDEEISATGPPTQRA